MHETDATSPAVTDIGAFCRAVEAHLCRVNGGHLVRIVGPAFELVAGWAKEGMPLRIVLHGVDRTVARLTAKGPRRRPVRIEFCEADVRDAADQWRRAVGVHAVTSMAIAAVIARRHGRAPAVVAKASRARPRAAVCRHRHECAAAGAERGRCRPPSASSTRVSMRRVARAVQARTAIVERLVTIEHTLTQAARSSLPEARRQELIEQVRNRALALPRTDASQCLPRCRGRPLRRARAPAFLPAAGAPRWLTTHSC